MRTRAELVTRTAKLLGIIGAGQSLSAEDNNSIDEEIDGMVATLESEGIYRVADIEEIDDDAFLWLAHILALTCCTDFGMSAQALEQKGVTRIGAEIRLRTIMAAGPTGAVLRTEYY